MCNSIYMKCPKQANLQRQKVDYWLLGAKGSGEWGLTAHKYQIFFFENDENVLEFDSSDDFMSLRIIH